MKYAIVENGIVTNLSWIYEGNSNEFPNAVALETHEDAVPAAIGDSYADGVFTRDGETVVSRYDSSQATIAELDTAIVDLIYEYGLLESEVE